MFALGGWCGATASRSRRPSGRTLAAVWRIEETGSLGRSDHVILSFDLAREMEQVTSGKQPQNGWTEMIAKLLSYPMDGYHKHIPVAHSRHTSPQMMAIRGDQNQIIDQS